VVEDLTAAGAIPVYLTLGLILPEGFSVEDLTRVLAAARGAAEPAGVRVVTRAATVVPYGTADGCALEVTGIGLRRPPDDLVGAGFGAAPMHAGDLLLVPGPLGDPIVDGTLRAVLGSTLPADAHHTEGTDHG